MKTNLLCVRSSRMENFSFRCIQSHWRYVCISNYAASFDIRKFILKVSTGKHIIPFPISRLVLLKMKCPFPPRQMCHNVSCRCYLSKMKYFRPWFKYFCGPLCFVVRGPTTKNGMKICERLISEENL